MREDTSDDGEVGARLARFISKSKGTRVAL
jgi:hypothetical protein